MPLLSDQEYIFEWSPGEAIEDIDTDEDYIEDDINTSDDDSNVVNINEFITTPLSDDVNPNIVPDDDDILDDNDSIHSDSTEHVHPIINEDDNGDDDEPFVIQQDEDAVGDDNIDAFPHIIEPDNEVLDTDNDAEDHSAVLNDFSHDEYISSHDSIDDVEENHDEFDDNTNEVNLSVTFADASDDDSNDPSNPDDSTYIDEDDRSEIGCDETEERTRPSRNTTEHTTNDRVRMSQGQTYTQAVQFLTIQENYRKALQQTNTPEEVLKSALLDGNEGASLNDHCMKIACDVMFTQMSAKAGIKKFGERAVAALIKEFTQLDRGPMQGKPVVKGISADSLTSEERRAALEAVNLITEKRDGRIKGRTCADGSKQKRYLRDGEDYASPTVSLEALIATLVIDAYEERDVATFDVPGAYLHAEMDKDRVFMKLRGQFVDIMCDVNPEYKQYVTTEGPKHQKVLYLWVLRAIYGCIQSALLWYDLYVNTLEKLGFAINPYDRCVANKMINGSQCTIVFYVDDNKVSHIDPAVNDEILKIMSDHFGDLTITRGKKHTFLGMDLLFTEGRSIRCR